MSDSFSFLVDSHDPAGHYYDILTEWCPKDITVTANGQYINTAADVVVSCQEMETGQLFDTGPYTVIDMTVQREHPSHEPTAVWSLRKEGGA